MTKLKFKNLRVISTTTFALFLIFQPIPLGIRKFELVISLIIGFIILILNKEIKMKKFFFLLLMFLVSMLGVTYSIISYKLRFDIYQFARALIPAYIFFIFMFADIKLTFFKKIDKFLPILIFFTLINILLFYSGTDLYNATLELKLEETNRFYVHAIGFYSFAFVIALVNYKISIFPYSLMLFITQGKSYLIFIFFLIFPYFFKKKNLIKKLFLFLITFIFFSIFFYLLKDRIKYFFDYGDSYRWLEFTDIKNIIDPIRFLVGIGPGIAYRNFAIDNNFSINADYDTHNTFLTLSIIFGVPITLILIFFFYKSLLLKNFFLQMLLTVIFISSNLDLHTAIGFRYLVYKFSTSIKPKKKILSNI
jgi:hypothetical protein